MVAEIESLLNKRAIYEIWVTKNSVFFKNREWLRFWQFGIGVGFTPLYALGT
jgi:hypothetical protein